jgi:hypothetical protein
MRLHLVLVPLLVGLALPAAARAQAVDAAPALPEWERLAPEQRDALVAPLRERWDANPDQRARMLERAGRWQAMTPDERRRARHGVRRWQDMSPEKREQMRALYGRLRTLPEAERKALRERWKAMTPDQRREWVEAHPAPARAAPARKP